MSVSALARKLKLKAGQRAAILNAPQGYLEALQPLPDGVELLDHVEGQVDWAQLFIKNKAELDRLAPEVIGALKPDSILWITFPKGTSKIQTDLTRDKGWDTIQQANLKWIVLVSVDETWSAFAVRPYKPGEKRQSFR
jgi:hypothetical protein